MRASETTKFWTAITMVALAIAPVQAQQERIEDQDLLNLLDKVNQATVEDPVSGTSNEVQAVEVVETDSIVVGDMDTETVDSNLVDIASVIEAMDDPEGPIDILTDEIGGEDMVATRMDNLISVRFKGSLEEAITIFAELSGANIIIPELPAASQISVNLKDVEWRPALQSILDTYDYELYQRVSGSNVFSVRPRPAGAPEPQVVETFILKYATVPNAAVLIRELLPPEAKVSEFASRNMLVVKSTESSLGEVRAVLQSIDTVRQQVYIESKFMELSDDAQKDLGIDWSALQSYGFGTAGTTTQNYKKEDSSVRTDSSFKDANGVAYEDAKSYVNDGQRVPGSGIFTLEGVTPAVQDVATDGTSKILTSVLSADEFRVILSALQQNKGVNIVSNPKIIVANEEPANISIVRKEPNLKQERQQALNDTPDTITYTLDRETPFFEYGIKLDVTPSINTSSNITVQINPSLTRKFADKAAGDNTYPVIDEKSIRTIFNLASGQTAAIGGLTEVTEAEEEHRVPILGRIPLLGRLFSWKQTVRGQDETIIFVTVGLANTQELTEETGMPSDSELARRQVILDLNDRTLRDQDREYFEAQESDKLDDMLRVMRINEQRRTDKRSIDLLRQAEKDTGLSLVD